MCSKSEHRCTLCPPRETVKKLLFFFFLLEGEKKREAQNPQIAALVCFNHEPTESVAYNIVLASSSQNKD